MSFSIEPEQKIPVEEMRAKIEKPVLEDLKKYATFYNSSVSYVVQEVLRKAMASDKEFQQHLTPTVATADKKKSGKRSQAGPQAVEKTEKTAVA